MKKRVLLLSLFLGLFLINILLTSAYGSYSSFSLGNFFSEIGEDTMILGAVLVVSFALLNFALKRVFRGNTKTAGVVSFTLSLLITWFVNKSGFDFQGLFYNIGISEGFFSAIIPIIVIIGALILLWKVGLGFFLFIMGIFLFVISVFTDLIYSKGVAIALAIGFIIIGAWLIARKKHRPGYDGYRGYSRWQRHPKRTGWGKGLRSGFRSNKDNKYWKKILSKKMAEQEYRKKEAEAKRKTDQARREQETEAKEIQNKQYEKKVRTQRELQQKYREYINAADSICRSVGHIPKKGTKEYRKWLRYTQAVKTIEKMAKKQGIRL